MKIKVKKKYFKNVYIYIVLLLIFYTSGSIYNFVFYEHNILFKTILILLISFCILYLGKKEVQSLLLYLGIAALAFLWTLCGNGNLRFFFTSFVRITFVFIFAVYCQKIQIELLEYIYKLIVVMAVIYLLAWILFDLGPLQRFGKAMLVSIEVAEGEKREWRYTGFFNIYFRWKNMRRLAGLEYNASNGFFWEPGLYQIYLNFALWYGLFLRKKVNYSITVILIFAVFSTTSTTGIFTLLIILGGFLYANRSFLAKLLLLIPMGLFLVGMIENVWSEKVQYGTANVSSRFEDSFFLLEKWAQHPVFGYGMGNAGGFNGLLIFCTDFGLLGLIFIGFYVFHIFNCRKNVLTNLTLCSWLCLSLINEPIGYHSLLWLLLFVLYPELEKKRAVAFNNKYNAGIKLALNKD